MTDSNTVRIAALFDPSPDAISRAKELLPDAAVTTSYAELLAKGLEGIVIATPNAMHKSQTIAALESGASVFTQKPLALSSRDTEEILNIARQRNLLLAVDFSYRFTSAIKAVAGLLCRGQLGRVFALELVFHNAYGPDRDWYYDYKLAGGGCVMDLGVHLIDLLWLLSDCRHVLELNASLFNAGQPYAREQIEDFADISLRLANGIHCRLACSWRLPTSGDAHIFVGVYGTRGGLEFRNVGGSFYDFEAISIRNREVRQIASPPDEWGGRAIVHWAEKLAGGSGFDPAADRLLVTAKLIDRIYDKAACAQLSGNTYTYPA